jgi:hypothetical protein
VQFVAPSSTTCVSVQVDLHVSKKSSIDRYWLQRSIYCAKAAPKGPPFLMSKNNPSTNYLFISPSSF